LSLSPPNQLAWAAIEEVVIRRISATSLFINSVLIVVYPHKKIKPSYPFLDKSAESKNS